MSLKELGDHLKLNIVHSGSPSFLMALTKVPYDTKSQAVNQQMLRFTGAWRVHQELQLGRFKIQYPVRESRGRCYINVLAIVL